jgi:hypothetical protein
MRFLPFANLALATIAAGSLFAGSYDPDMPSADRYKHLWEKNPFVPPAPEENLVRDDGIEQQYALSGLVKVSNEWVAFVLDRKTLERVKISTETNEAGLQLVSVQEQFNPKDSTVILRSGTQTGMIRFDQNLLNAQANQGPEKQKAENSPQTNTAKSEVVSSNRSIPPQVAPQTTEKKNTQPPSARSVRRQPINLSR